MQHRCPMCKLPTDSDRDADFPFCSERCRLLDLGAWASEKYVVTGSQFDEAEHEERPRGDRVQQRKPDDTVH